VENWQATLHGGYEGPGIWKWQRYLVIGWSFFYSMDKVAFDPEAKRMYV
jgi:hypothetical protein